MTPELAHRVRDLLDGEPGLSERRMFGGIAWLAHGNMAVVVGGEGGLMVRVARADHDALLAEPGAATMVMRGRPLRGWLTVSPEACGSDLAVWVRRGLAYARTLPPK